MRKWMRAKDHDKKLYEGGKMREKILGGFD